ncbi:hypothetical protein [Polluticoccus soli]|uniref:hypothetical protein n=1 Tax=Polluticoccus soli TaxID=3034150 RepID=UPI0023E28EFA|nr:hypothetical protein [Flavipsychrobacter sp. JY13-12]
MRISLIGLFVFMSSACFAQQEFDCKAFLAQEIKDETPEQVMKECQNFLHCGLDNTDMTLFVQPAAIASIRVDATNKKEQLTYGYILKQIQQFTEAEDYKKFKKLPKQQAPKQNP